MTAKARFTTAAFRRATGGMDPRGRGTWAFQCSKTDVAFDRDLFGEVRFFSGTYTEAKRQAREAGMTGIVAVLS